MGISAGQQADFDRLVRILNPNGIENEEYVTLMTAIFTSLGGAESVLDTKGDIAVFGAAIVALGVGANGTLLAADSTEASGLKYKTLLELVGGSEIVFATADTDFNNTETPADITGLETSILPVGKYLVECMILAESATGTPELDLLFIGSANTTLVWQVGDSVLDAEIVTLAIAAQGRVLVSNQVGMTLIKGYLDVVDTPGTLKLQGAQGTATVEDTTVSLGSTLKVTKLA